MIRIIVYEIRDIVRNLQCLVFGHVPCDLGRKHCSRCGVILDWSDLR